MGKEKPGAGLRLFNKTSDCIYKNFRLRIQILYQFLITIGKIIIISTMSFLKQSSKSLTYF